jgi:hypothetical protein
VTGEVGGAELILVRQQHVVHLPECALRAGRLRCLRRELGVWVEVGQREVPPDEPQIVAEGFQQPAKDPLGPAAVGALEVAVLNERDRRGLRSADVVTLRVDVIGQVNGFHGDP